MLCCSVLCGPSLQYKTRQRKCASSCNHQMTQLVYNDQSHLAIIQLQFISMLHITFVPLPESPLLRAKARDDLETVSNVA